MMQGSFISGNLECGKRCNLYRVLLIFALLSLPAIASAEWTKTDTKFQLTYTALHIADWGQTRYVAKHPESYKEANPLIGEHPSVKKVDRYMASTLIMHTVISFWMQGEDRRIWQCISIGAKAAAVGHNYRIGVKIDF